MHAILYRNRDWRWRLINGSRIVASGEGHASPSKAQRAVEAIVRGVVKELHQPFAPPGGITFFRLPLKDGSFRVEW